MLRSVLSGGVRVLSSVRRSVASSRTALSSDVHAGDVESPLRNRERAMENAFFNKQQEEQLRKLAAELLAKEKAAATSGGVAATSDAAASSGPALSGKVVPIETFNAYREEVTRKLRALEDELHALKYKH